MWSKLRKKYTEKLGFKLWKLSYVTNYEKKLRQKISWTMKSEVTTIIRISSNSHILQHFLRKQKKKEKQRHTHTPTSANCSKQSAFRDHHASITGPPNRALGTASRSFPHRNGGLGSWRLCRGQFWRTTRSRQLFLKNIVKLRKTSLNFVTCTRLRRQSFQPGA